MTDRDALALLLAAERELLDLRRENLRLRCALDHLDGVLEHLAALEDVSATPARVDRVEPSDQRSK